MSGLSPLKLSNPDSPEQDKSNVKHYDVKLGIQANATRYLDILSVLQRLEQGKHTDKIHGLLSTIFKNEIAFTMEELGKIQEEAVDRGDYSFNMTYNLINNFGIFKNNMKTILQLILKRSLMTHLESTKDTAQEKVIEFGSKGGKSEGDKRLMELDALIRKRQMELNNSPKKQRYNGSEQEMNESLASKLRVDKTGFYGPATGTAGFGLPRATSSELNQKPKNRRRSASPTQTRLTQQSRDGKLKGTFSKKPKEIDYDNSLPGPGAYYAENYQKHGVQKAVFKNHEPEKLIIRQNNIPDSTSIYNSHYLDSKDIAKMRRSQDF